MRPLTTRWTTGAAETRRRINGAAQPDRKQHRSAGTPAAPTRVDEAPAFRRDWSTGDTTRAAGFGRDGSALGRTLPAAESCEGMCRTDQPTSSISVVRLLAGYLRAGVQRTSVPAFQQPEGSWCRHRPLAPVVFYRCTTCGAACCGHARTDAPPKIPLCRATRSSGAHSASYLRSSPGTAKSHPCSVDRCQNDSHEGNAWLKKAAEVPRDREDRSDLKAIAAPQRERHVQNLTAQDHPQGSRTTSGVQKEQIPFSMFYVQDLPRLNRSHVPEFGTRDGTSQDGDGRSRTIPWHCGCRTCRHRGPSSWLTPRNERLVVPSSQKTTRIAANSRTTARAVRAVIGRTKSRY